MKRIIRYILLLVLFIPTIVMAEPIYETVDSDELLTCIIEFLFVSIHWLVFVMVPIAVMWSKKTNTKDVVKKVIILYLIRADAYVILMRQVGFGALIADVFGLFICAMISTVFLTGAGVKKAVSLSNGSTLSFKSSNSKECPYCGKKVSEDSTKCYYCSKPFEEDTFKNAFELEEEENNKK